MTTAASPHTTGRVLHWATGYDVLVWFVTLGRERAFREKMLNLAHLAPDESVLDVGCGTGTLAIAAKRLVGRAGAVYGIDASEKMIARAGKKAAKARVDIGFRHAVVEALPFADAQFDVVLSTLMLHHLGRKARQQCAREIRRVLKPNGRVLVVDFARPQRRHGFMAHFRRHGYVDVRDIVTVLGDAELKTIESGAVGVKDLQFVLASPGSALGNRSTREAT